MNTESNIKKLYKNLKQINLNLFFDNFPKGKKTHYDLNNQMMFIGTEFETVFTSILAQKFGLKARYLKIFLSKQELLNKTFVRQFEGQEIKKIPSFNLQKFLKEYSYKGNIKTKNNFKKDEKHIKDLLKNIDFEKFKPKKQIITKVKIKTELDCTYMTNFSGEIDLIIDDKLIDIKTDTTLKLNKNYIVQLLYYYFLIKYSQSLVNDEDNLLEKIRINKLCLYYASFDLLIEFDIDKLFSNKKYLNEINNLIDNDLVNYNFKFKEILKFVVFKTELNENYFLETSLKIIENQKKILKSYIDLIFKIRLQKSINIDYKREFLLQIIKINLLLLEIKSNNSISEEVESSVLEYLLFSFRDSNEKVFNQNLTKFKEKHLYMSINDYIRMEEIYWVLNYTDKKNKNYNSHIDELIKIESDNEEEFNCFIKNYEVLFSRFYNQMNNKIISENEFKLISELMLDLIEFKTINKLNKKLSKEKSTQIVFDLDFQLKQLYHEYKDGVFNEVEYKKKKNRLINLAEKIERKF